MRWQESALKTVTTGLTQINDFFQCANVAGFQGFYLKNRHINRLHSSMSPRDSRILEFFPFPLWPVAKIRVIPLVADRHSGYVTKLQQKKNLPFPANRKFLITKKSSISITLFQFECPTRLVGSFVVSAVPTTKFLRRQFNIPNAMVWVYYFWEKKSSSTLKQAALGT
jgi:hypothetical protein